MKRLYIYLIICLSTISFSLFGNSPIDANSKKANGFIENCGQIVDQNNMINTNVDFIWPAGNGLNVQLRSTGLSYDTYQKNGNDIAFHRMDVDIVGMNSHAMLNGVNPFSNTENYYSSFTKSNISGVETFEAVTYTDVYENIDFAVSVTDKGQLKYDFIVNNPNQADEILLKYAGFDSFKMVDQNLIFNLSGRTITEHIPDSWMSNTNRKVKMAYRIIEEGCDYVIMGFKTTDSFSRKDEGQLIIDPLAVLEWGTYYGDSLYDVGNAVATDSLGNVFVTGTTSSLNRMASSDSYQSVFSGGSSDVFIVKLNQHGLRHWASYYGGSGDDKGLGIDVNSYGTLYIVGSTTSADSIGNGGGYQPENGGGTDGFVAQFDRFGNFEWDSFIGAAGYDEATACAADGLGNVIVVGNTNASGFLENDTIPLLFDYQGNTDAFIAKYNAAGQMVYASYYGGYNADYATDIVVDSLYNAVIAGYTYSSENVSWGSAFQNDLEGDTDGFALKLDSAGMILWATYFGGPGNDKFTGVTSVNHDFYFSGITDSLIAYTDTNSFQDQYAGNYDGFVTRLSGDGMLEWFSYIGGEGTDVANGISRDFDGAVYIVGTTTTLTDSIITTTEDSLAIYPEGENAYVMKFNQTGERIWGEYYGGESYDLGLAIAVHGLTSVYITGLTLSEEGISKDGPFENSHQQYEPNLDTLAYMARFTQINSTFPIACGPGYGGGNGNGGGGGGGGSSSDSTANLPPGVCIGDSILIGVLGGALGQGAQWIWYADSCGGDLNFIDEGPQIWVRPDTTTTYYVRAESVDCITQCANTTVYVDYPNTAIASANDSICPGTALELFGDGGYFYYWYASDTLISTDQNPVIDTIMPSQAGTYTLIANTMFGCSDTTTVDVFLLPIPEFDVQSSNVTCPGEQQGKIEILSTGDPITVNWPQLNTDEFSVSDLLAGTYIVEITNDFGCTITQGIEITEPLPLTDSLVIEPAYCDETNGNAEIFVSGGTAPYTINWLPMNASGTAINNVMAGTYMVVYTDSKNCADTTVFSIPNLGGFTAIIAPDSVFLDYFNNAELFVYTDPVLEDPEIVWTPEQGLSCTDCADPIANPDASTLYTVMITSQLGCEGQDSIYVDRPVPPNNSFIPTAFSPNGDGLNDMLCVLGIGKQPFKLTIYDRFGTDIFISSSALNCWDGTVKGAPATGVYVYTFEAVLANDKVVSETGHITIHR